MKLREKNNDEFIKIQIGRWKSGTTGFIKPTKSIQIEQATINEVYKKIMRMLENEK